MMSKEAATDLCSPVSPGTVGVLLCGCHGTMGGPGGLDAVHAALASDPDVAAVLSCPDLCSAQGIEDAATKLAAASCDRAVLAGCKAMESFLPGQGTAQVGLADGCSALAMIRDVCGQVSEGGQVWSERAIEVTRNAVRRVLAQREIESLKLPVIPAVMVLGGGQAAAMGVLALAEAGRDVHWVVAGADPEADTLSEFGRFLRRTFSQVDCLGCGEPDEESRTVRQAQAHPRVTMHTNAMLSWCCGQAGHFEVALTVGEGQDVVPVGALVASLTDLAMLPVDGASAHERTSMTDLLGLVRQLDEGTIPKGRIALVLDADREQGRLANMLSLAAARFLVEAGASCVRVYCRHVRVAGKHLEALYRSARAAGVEFVRHDGDLSISSTAEGSQIVATDAQLGCVLDYSVDLVVQAGIAPMLPEGTPLVSLLSRTGRSTLGPASRNVWFQPHMTNRPGIFVVGADGSDLDLGRVDSDVGQAVADSEALLGDGAYICADDAADIDPEKCVACLTCIRICPHKAIDFDSEKESAVTSKIACRRCGVCAAECPARAIQLPRYTDAELDAELEQHSEIAVFACANSAAPAAASAIRVGWGAKAAVQVIPVPCAGKVDSRHILMALERGAKHVFVLGCNPESCQYIDGASRARTRTAELKELLGQAGLDAGRVHWGALISGEQERFLAMVHEVALSLETETDPERSMTAGVNAQ
ncbi:MAG: hydrogenase iron-sulfur subunit [Lentisphaerae bacterium]|nr:hydrogenase iron-sulfur subunit [Lentisphaerota bacterium]